MRTNSEEEKLARKVINSAKSRKFADAALWLIILGLLVWVTYPSSDEGIKADIISKTDIAREQKFLDDSVNTDLKMVVVTKVVDGDTFHYQEGKKQMTVRMIGIDTPETVDPRKTIQCFGKEASDETKKLIQGKSVILKKDSLETGLDKYGRQLLYVYLTDGTFVNERLVAEGFAHATPQYRFDQKENFVDLENKARIAGKGLWNSEVCQ